MPARRTFDREKVASVMLEAIDLGLPVISTVQEVMDVTRNQARHMVRMAHQEGLLGHAEHKPARATIHRGSPAERTWVVCTSCLATWPCDNAFAGSYLQNGEDSHEPRRRRRAPRSRPRADRKRDEHSAADQS